MDNLIAGMRNVEGLGSCSPVLFWDTPQCPVWFNPPETVLGMIYDGFLELMVVLRCVWR
jgi:hypothetical protein